MKELRWNLFRPLLAASGLGLLATARALGMVSSRVPIVGCRPAGTEELSRKPAPVVRGVVPGAIRAILEELGRPVRWQGESRP